MIKEYLWEYLIQDSIGVKSEDNSFCTIVFCAEREKEKQREKVNYNHYFILIQQI